jgi:hypothetical protein
MPKFHMLFANYGESSAKKHRRSQRCLAANYLGGRFAIAFEKALRLLILTKD